MSAHQFLHGADQFVDHIILAGTDVPRHTATDVPGEDLFVEGVQSRLYRARLCQNVRAIGVLLNHGLQAADLPFNAP